jgi:putative ABC transport system permease protein
MAVADLALVAAAAGGLVVLRAQGGTSSGAADWYTSAAPVLVAVGVAVVVVRGYPWLVRQALRLSGRGTGVTAFVGLARAVRTAAGTILPAFGLILVLGVVAFGATVQAAVLRGDTAASWQQAGADVVVDASGSYAPLSPSAQRAIAGVPGVRAVAAVSQTSATGAGGAVLGVLVVNPARYAALVADTPLPAFPSGPIAGPAAGPALPVLVSPGAAAALLAAGKLIFGSTTVRVRDAGVITSTPGLPEPGPFIVMSAASAAHALGAVAAAPDVLLVAGSGIDQGRLSVLARSLLPGSTVIVRARLLAALTSAPLPHGAYVTFALGSAAAAGFGIVIMAIMLALGARPRELTLARLFTMGLSPGQARRLVAAEALPVILAAAVGGAICAWLLVPLVGPAIDLAPFTGTSAAVPLRPDYLTIGLVLGALVVLALATLLAQSAMTRLRGLGRALRVGE